ncbi:MAG: 4Fe-4S binding protein [Caldilineaceae bacterium]|nr:4Fe-4S binding protein [Caldilineaceae bacterium]MBP8109548.1 4Fe-4S binding protein [Caldilineaceae bacterium]MBP8121892.1 4Fe-4S binding protein [Caldilineaceae bacterium]MBP9073143.1 4Fe-4S binding protein [Caldilineaceae bacterium]
MDPLPEIDANLCTGCKACVEICPTQALSQVAEKAVLHRPDLCTYCSACQDVCPEGAIALPFMIVFAKPASVPTVRLG